MEKSKRKGSDKSSSTSKKKKVGDDIEKEESKLSIKILVDTKAKKVLFAEAGKDFVDFLFHIMSLPVGTIIKLLNVNGMVGCLGSLYKSIDSLSNDYFNEDLNKDAVLMAGLPVNVPLLLSMNDDVAASPATDAKEFYLCDDCLSEDEDGYITDCHGATCPICRNHMSLKLRYFRPTAGSQSSKPSANTSSGNNAQSVGYVKGVVTYMVMDDLEVKPQSTIAGISVINKLRVKDISALEEKEVKIGFKEGLAMLKASLETDTVLTTVFLKAKN